MSDAFTYNVIVNGEILDSFERPQVHEAFAQLFKLSPEKSSQFLSAERIIKKEVDLKQAHLYKRKLENIGLVVRLIVNQPVVSVASQKLSLTPMEGEPVAESEQLTEPTGVEFICPKCAVPQTKGQFCIGCGVCFQKLAPPLAQPGDESNAQPAEHSQTPTAAETVDRLKIVSLLACGVAALLGALIWLGIAMAFDYELGLVAWMIGGMVGYAALLTGSRGQTTGIACALFTILAIFGGKYMTIENIQSQWSQLATSAEFQTDELHQAFEEEKQVATLYFEQQQDPQAVRQLMVDYQYSDAFEPANVSDEEIANFQTYTVPRLSQLATGEATFEQWLTESVSLFQDLSTMEIIQEDFGFIDFIFLILGVATAFRLGSGMQTE
jgi:hypothetical protein